MSLSTIQGTFKFKNPEEGDSLVVTYSKRRNIAAQQVATIEKHHIKKAEDVELPGPQPERKQDDSISDGSNMKFVTGGGNVTVLVGSHDVAVAGHAEKSSIQGRTESSVINNQVVSDEEMRKALRTLKKIIPKLPLSRTDQRVGTDIISRAWREIGSASQPDKQYIAKTLSLGVKTIMDAGKVAGVFNNLKQVFEATAKWCGEHGQEILNLIPIK
jgi:hypothetical protein